MLYVNSLNMSPLIIVLVNLNFNASFKCYLMIKLLGLISDTYIASVFLHVHVHVKFLYNLGWYIFLFFKEAGLSTN